MKKIIAKGAVFAILLLFFGCGFFASEGENAMHETIAASKNLIDTLQSVQDEKSARAAISGLDAKYTRLTESYQKLIEHKDDKVWKETADELNRQAREMGGKLAQEGERLRNLRGLPAEFWKIAKLRSLDIAAKTLKLLQTTQHNAPVDILNKLSSVRDLLAKYGYEKVIQVELKNLPSELESKAFDKLRQGVPGAELQDIFDVEGKVVFIGPVQNYRTYLANLDLGTVTFEDEAQRDIRLTVDRRKLGARANSNIEEAELRFKEHVEEAEKRRKEMELEHAKVALEIAKEQKAWQEKMNGPEPSDPDYYEKLADMMVTGDHFQQEKAIDALLGVTPSEVDSAETRKKIARNFKKLAENGNVFDQEKAVKGLAIWGGKYSAPILLKMLDDSHRTSQKEIIQALGDLKDSQAAEALAARLGDFFNHEAAYNALKQIGAGAEDALIAVGPSSDAQVCLAAINLLGDAGTEKSLAFLREAQTSRNPDVRAAAKAAVRKIMARKNAAKSSKS